MLQHSRVSHHDADYHEDDHEYDYKDGYDHDADYTDDHDADYQRPPSCFPKHKMQTATS